MKQVLVVEDDSLLALALVEALEDAGHSVGSVRTGEAALEALTEQYRDAVLLDFKLPGMSGLEACRRMRRDTPDTRVFFMTGFRPDQLLNQVDPDATVTMMIGVSEPTSIAEELRGLGNSGVVLVFSTRFDYSDVLKGFLSEQGQRVFVARDADDIRNLRPEGGFNMLVLDVKNNFIDNLLAFQEVRKQHPPMPTVMVLCDRGSGLSESDPLRNLSVTGCFFKPFSPEPVLEALDQITERKAPDD